MTGTYRWNLYGGAAAFVLTFIISITRNVIGSTLLNSLYSFLLVFVLMYFFRFVLHFILNGTGTPDYPENLAEAEAGNQTAGTNVDFSTPDDDNLKDLLKPGSGKTAPDSVELEFAPLKPPKFVSQQDLDPEELANALRRMSEE